MIVLHWRRVQPTWDPFPNLADNYLQKIDDLRTEISLAKCLCYIFAAIASLFGIGLGIGLNAGAGLVLILPVTLLTPLILRQGGSRPENAAPAEEALPGLSQASEGRG